MSARRVWLSVLAVALGTAGAQAAQTSQVLVLELWINGANTHRDVVVKCRGERFYLSRQDLGDAGVLATGSEPDIALDGTSPIKAALDESDQRLLVQAPSEYLLPQTFDLRPSNRIAVQAPATGLILDYDLFAQSGSGQNSAFGATQSASLFAPFGVLRGSGFARWTAGRTNAARLDSSLLFDDPDHVRTWTVGDAISGGLSWSRSIRFAGLQLASNYALRPDLVTIPLPQFFGDTAVPASVDVLVGAARVFEADVAPGPFELRNLPVITGGSEATVTIRDILGRETSQTLSLFDAGDLLAPGLDEYSLDAGWARGSYGERSFDYGDAIVSATLRHGASGNLTLQGHAEASRHVQMAGAGLVLAFQPFAVLGLDAAASAQQGRAGHLAAVNLHSRWHRYTAFASYQTASSAFGDLAAQGNSPFPRARWQVGLDIALDRAGSLSLSAVESCAQDGSAAHLLAGTYSIGLGGRFLTVNGFFDRQSGNWSLGALLSVPLGNRDVLAASSEFSAGPPRAALSYEHEGNPDGGIGYRARASFGAGPGGDAQAVWYGDDMTVRSGISASGGTIATELGLDGTLIAMDGGLFAARQSGDAVALVRTGRQGVHVTLENRAVAVSGRDGDALVPGLVAFAPNKIGIDADDYPISTLVAESERVVAPRRYAAVVVDLAPRIAAPLLVRIRLADGSVPPPGSRAVLDKDDTQVPIFGRNGKLFLEDLREPDTLTVELPQGSCRVRLAPPKPLPNRIAELGPLLCESPDHAP